MPRPLRPVKTFVLRLWREPGAPPGPAGWRGILRPLEAKDAPPRELAFHGLGSLPTVLSQSLAADDPPEGDRPSVT